MPQLAPGADKLLVYGLDGNIDVAVRTEAEGRVDRARIADGVLELTRVEQQRFAYAVTPRFAGPRAASCWSSRCPPAGESQLQPTPWSTVTSCASTAAWKRPSRWTLAVVLERPVVQRLALIDLDTDALQLEFNGVTPPAELRECPAAAADLVGRGRPTVSAGSSRRRRGRTS